MPRSPRTLEPSGARFVAPQDLDIALETSDGRDQETLVAIPLDVIGPAPWQSRREFDLAALGELAESIGEHGVLQPIIVRRAAEADADGPIYELICGERRLRAARLAVTRRLCALTVGPPTIPARIVDVSEVEARAMTLAENLIRVDISAVEIALGYRELRDSLTSAGEKAGVRALARRTSHAVAIVSEYLRIADAITEELLVETGVAGDKPGTGYGLLARLSKAALLRIASRATMEDRAESLRIELRRTLGRRPGHDDESELYELTPAEDDPARRSWKGGSLSVRISAPVAHLSPLAARRSADALTPALRALVRRAEPDAGYRLARSGPGCVVTVPDARLLSDEHRRVLRTALMELLGEP